MSLRNLLIIILTGLLAACGAGSASSPSVINNSLNGNYYLSAVSLTETDINGGNCGDGSGTLTISDETISGTILSTNGVLFDIVGTVDSSGLVTGGFAQGGENAARFEGSIAGTRGSGTWSDLFECNGTWEAIKNI